MADLTNNPILSVYATVGSKISDLVVKDGQLIFVQDKHKLAFDFGGKRTFYNQIEELATDSARTSMLAPVAGLFYYVIETSKFWVYQDEWVPITITPNEVSEYVDNAIASLNQYIFDIDYEKSLAFDTSELVIQMNTSPVLGQAILGQMVLA